MHLAGYFGCGSGALGAMVVTPIFSTVSVRGLAIASGFGEPARRPVAPFGSVAARSMTWSRVRPRSKMRCAFSARSLGTATNLPGATRTRFILNPPQPGTLPCSVKERARPRGIVAARSGVLGVVRLGTRAGRSRAGFAATTGSRVFALSTELWCCSKMYRLQNAGRRPCHMKWIFYPLAIAMAMRSSSDMETTPHRFCTS